MSSEDARIVVEECLGNVRAMLELALREQRYGEVAVLGSAAAGLASTLKNVWPLQLGDPAHRLGDAPFGDGQSVEFSSVPARQSNKPSVRSLEHYPRFERSGSRLIKIGWSKRDSAEYEHKAPRGAVDAVVKALTSRSKRPFTMDEVLPVRAADGLDVPSYQAYLVVAWLRAIGAVERIGNDGYTARADRLAPSEIDKLWADLKTQHGATTDVA